MIKVWIEKLINIPIMQLSFVYILKIECQTIQSFSKFLWITFKTVCLDVRYWKFGTIMVNIAKAHILFVKKESSVVLSSNIAGHDWKVICVFKLKRKNLLFCEINMKISLKQVDLDSSITVAKNKLVKIFIVVILNL